MTTLFNNIQIGKKFKSGSSIVYQKTSTKHAKPIRDNSNRIITNGKSTIAFYDSKIQLTLVYQGN